MFKVDLSDRLVAHQHLGNRLAPEQRRRQHRTRGGCLTRTSVAFTPVSVISAPARSMLETLRFTSRASASTWHVTPLSAHSALHGFQLPSVLTNVPGLDFVITKPTKRDLGHGAAFPQFICQVLWPMYRPDARYVAGLKGSWRCGSHGVWAMESSGFG